ncbi:hypothetical protein [Cytophaga aurantiaca]|uniref:hypothetical protein n=1 Tax=Cytophaga aurantiaca TaxID=29530 RepID=UPI00037D4602|nr:hypothetical protein [Cytophaga aurantiaca]
MTHTSDTSFIFPYSENKETKRQQVWSNLEKGILFEDANRFIPWTIPFADLDSFAEERKGSGDRTNWFLGKHQILDGYESAIGVMKWSWVNDTNSFSEIEEWLGYDDEGNKKFLLLKGKLTDLLGEPTLLELEKFGGLDLGSIEWTNQNVRIALTGIEQFACKYRMYIGLKENKNR